jgi:hypothetical protein
MVLVAAALFFSFSGSPVSAQDTYWEGGVSISPYGMLPRTGLYAASNAFPQDTKVKVTNTETGKSVEVRVVERLDDPHLFMLVSPEAGEALGIREDEVVRGTVSTAKEKNGMVTGDIAQERAFSPDPDRNPSAAVDGAAPVDDSEGLAVLEEYLEEEGVEPGAEETAEARGEGAPGPETGEPSPDVSGAVAVGPSAGAEAAEEAGEPGEPEEPEAAGVGEAATEEESPEVSPHSPEAPKAASVNGEAGAAAGPEADITRPELAAATVPEPDLPEPDVQRGERPERVEVPDKGEEPAKGPFGSSVGPLFVQERDTSYSPQAPLPPEELGEREGPQASLAYADEYPLSDTEVFAAAQPRLPESGLSRPELVKVSPEEDEFRVTRLHSPKIREEERAEEQEKVAEEAPAEPRTEEPGAEDRDEEPGDIPEGAELALRPAEERPPEAGPDKEPEEAQEAERTVKQPPRRREPAFDEDLAAEAKFTDKLTSSSYYLQLAAYQELKSAKELASKLLPRYPVTIYTGKGETFPYKVMVGPLNEDESGAMLYSFTSRGYRDAFLRRGN